MVITAAIHEDFYILYNGVGITSVQIRELATHTWQDYYVQGSMAAVGGIDATQYIQITRLPFWDYRVISIGAPKIFNMHGELISDSLTRRPE